MVKLQQALECLGYYDGAIDGVYGEGTVSAVKQFQKKRNMKDDGIAGSSTIRVLFGSVGTSSSSSSSKTYETEVLDWFEDKVTNVIPKNARFTIKDVKTGKTFEVVPGDLFFARPSQLIRYSADEQQPWEYSWVGFNGACAHKLAAQLPFTDDAPVHHTSDPDGMRAALTNIYSSRGLQPQDEAAMVGYLYLFIAALMRETSAGKPHTASSSSQYVLNAIKYIQFNYSHDISIDDVAKSVGVSRSHLYRVFMLNVGKSPIDYLTEYRINEACKLLRAGNLSIAEVAVSVGFFDQFYFSRVFKRAKGVPPSKYFAAQQDADPASPAQL